MEEEPRLMEWMVMSSAGEAGVRDMPGMRNLGILVGVWQGFVWSSRGVVVLLCAEKGGRVPWRSYETARREF